MKFVASALTCLALLGALQPGKSWANQAFKNWAWSTLDDGAFAQTMSTKQGNSAEIWILFFASMECMPQIAYAQSIPKNHTGWTEGPVQLTYQLRVDQYPVWTIPKNTVTGKYIRLQGGNFDYYVMTMDLPVKMLSEIVKGNALRLMRDDNAATDRFSLSGSAFTLRSAYRYCGSIAGPNNDPDLKYFNQGGSNSSPPTPSNSKDPDRAYFR